MKGINAMSCNNRNIRNIDTNIYTSTTGCCQNDYDVRIVERVVPCYFYPPRPFPPSPEPPAPQPPGPPVFTSTLNYAEFFNNAATGITFNAGENVSYPSTLYNTDTAGIVNNNGVITLSGGKTGRTYLLNYQVTGTTADDAVIGLEINGSVDANTQIVPNSATGTSNGSYIVNFPANTTSTVALRVVSGTVTTASPTIGTNFSVVRIA